MSWFNLFRTARTIDRTNARNSKAVSTCRIAASFSLVLPFGPPSLFASRSARFQMGAAEAACRQVVRLCLSSSLNRVDSATGWSSEEARDPSTPELAPLASLPADHLGDVAISP